MALPRRSTVPGKEPGEQQNQVDDMRVTVIRPEIDQARERLTAALVGVDPVAAPAIP